MTWNEALQAFEEKIPGFTERESQTALAHAVEHAFETGTALLGQAPPGCLQGDALITVNRAGLGRAMRLDHIVARFNGEDAHLPARKWDSSIPTYIQREVDGVVRLGRLLNAWCSGIKQTYTVTTDTGRTLRATDEHPFLTERGWLRLDELQPGDLVHVRGPQASGKGREAKPRYHQTFVVAHPFSEKSDNHKHNGRIGTHRLVAEAELNHLPFAEYLRRVRVGEPGLTFLDPAEYAVHHKDHDPSNNRVENLMIMTHTEHHRLHADEGKTDNVLYKIVTEAVVSVEPYGEEMTYDIEVADDPHNFIANGFVVHNTGKSYVAIITLRDHARAMSMPCVASTATKALQDQYIADCRRIRDVYDPNFRFMVLKGRGNYLCRAKMAKADETLLDVDLDEITKRAEDEDVIGDVERLGIELTAVQRRELTTTSDECPGKNQCKFGAVCFAERAKAKAENSDVIVVSHALLAADATLKNEGVALLPMYPGVVVDEAHELRGYVESALSTEVTQRSLTQLTADVVSFTNERELVGPGEYAAAALFSKFERVLSREREMVLTPAVVIECAEELQAVINHVETLDGKVAVTGVDSDDELNRKRRLRKRCQNFVRRLRKIVLDDFADTVRWIERDRPEDPRRSRGVLLKTAPLDVAPFLAEAVWNYTTPVLLSATLAIHDQKRGGAADFDFMAKEQGIDLAGDYRTFDGPTPFDFRTQAITYIPEHMPNIRTSLEQFRSAFVFENKELIRAADGRSMLLFTSWAELNYAYTELAPWIRETLGHQVFRQGDMSSTRMLADAFAEDEHSVLFGTKSFFTGVNVEGDSLRYLGIQKLPFHFPDPLWRARCDAIDSLCDDRSKWTRGSHPTLQVPDMIMTLIQGYGRLIRTVSDRGLVAIFDAALSMSSGTKYGKTRVRPALPPAPIVSSLRPAVDYLRSLDQVAVSA